MPAGVDPAWLAVCCLAPIWAVAASLLPASCIRACKGTRPCRLQELVNDFQQTTEQQRQESELLRRDKEGQAQRIKELEHALACVTQENARLKEQARLQQGRVAAEQAATEQLRRQHKTVQWHLARWRQEAEARGSALERQHPARGRGTTQPAQQGSRRTAQGGSTSGAAGSRQHMRQEAACPTGGTRGSHLLHAAAETAGDAERDEAAQALLALQQQPVVPSAVRDRPKC